MKTVGIYIFLFVLGLYGHSQAADCIRCRGQLVCVGDGESLLIGKCGNPDYIEDRGIVKIPLLSGGYAYKPVRVFYYNCGSDRLVQFVTLTGGVITGIVSGDYGNGPLRCNE